MGKTFPRASEKDTGGVILLARLATLTWVDQNSRGYHEVYGMTSSEPPDHEGKGTPSVFIDDAKKVTELGPVKALLSPTADLFGQIIRDKVEDWLEKKRKDNLDAHSQAVLKNETINPLSDQSQLDLFVWADKAQNVTEDEKEEAAAVRAALEAIIQNKRGDADVLLDLNKEEILYLTQKDQ